MDHNSLDVQRLRMTFDSNFEKPILANLQKYEHQYRNILLIITAAVVIAIVLAIVL